MPVRQKGIAPTIIILIVVAVLGAAGYFGYTKGYLNQFINKNNDQIYITPAPYPLNTHPPDTSSPIATPQATSSKLYLLKLKLKSDPSLPPVGMGTQTQFYKLADYLTSLLKLPEKSISQLLYDARVTTPYQPETARYNSNFYAILSQATSLNTSYADQYLTVTTQTVDDAFLPYLIKTDYCEKDADCSLGADMCTQGAFNYYKKYVDPPWGCGPGQYKSTYSWFKWGEHDATLNCDTELKFDGVKCTNNQCTESGFKKVCVE